MNDTRPSLRHEPDQNRFVTTVDGVEAHLEYELVGGRMVITHTIVPQPIAGRGIAGLLVGAAFDHARAQGLKVHTACAYADVWAGRHPEVADLLA